MINYKSYRIKFQKTGLAKYISHLDLNRLLSRALARAGVEAAHSEGFNPRPKITFASAVSLGVESLCEFVDIKTYETETQIFEKIKNAFPQGINILEVYEPENAFKYIDRTRYNIFLKSSGFGPGGLDKLFEGDISVEKKPGIIINLKDYICELVISEEMIDVVLKTNLEMFLNPENIIKAVSLKYAVDDYFIKKVEVYHKNNTVFK